MITILLLFIALLLAARSPLVGFLLILGVAHSFLKWTEHELINDPPAHVSTRK